MIAMAFSKEMVARIEELEVEGLSLERAIEVAGFELYGGDNIALDRDGNPVEPAEDDDDEDA